uniref:Uncharacterized protein n=1 Tax=Rhizophora mucronata TaxID=61149 RepID=A0A2P2Q7Q0_RHIMU
MLLYFPILFDTLMHKQHHNWQPHAKNAREHCQRLRRHN